MPDRAVVISELEQIADHFRRCANVYPDLGFEEREQAVRDAIALLREQEPVKLVPPITADDPWWNCASCGGVIETDQYRFCPWCGREVKWDAAEGNKR